MMKDNVITTCTVDEGSLVTLDMKKVGKKEKKIITERYHQWKNEQGK